MSQFRNTYFMGKIHAFFSPFWCRVLFIIVLSLVLSGCASSGHKQFYSQIAPSRYAPTEKVDVFEYSNVDLRELYNLLYSDFLIIGKSSFNGPYELPNNSVSFAESIGADVFLATSQFKETKTSLVGINIPTVNTSYVSGYSGGAMFGGTVTSYGTQSSMMPITIHRYDQDGLFLKNINRVVPLWKKKSGDYPAKGSSVLDGRWQNENYILKIYNSNDKCVAVIDKVTGKVKGWGEGDVKFLFKPNSGQGVYLMGDRTPQPAKFLINKFGHLEATLYLGDETFSFSRVGKN